GFCWLCLGRAATEKIGTDLVMPFSLLTFALIALAIHLGRRGLYRECLALTVLVLACLAIGNRMLANHLVGQLENRYADSDPFQHEPMEALILLGGATGETPYGGVQVNFNGDRLVTAARLYHRGLAKQIYCTGQRTAAVSKMVHHEAEHAEKLLIDLGVPPAKIVRLGGRNTAEEMQAIAQQLGAKPVGIVTSAWHLPRAMRLARRERLKAVAIPSNYLGHGAADDVPPGAMIRDCVPSHAALYLNARVMREYLANLVGR
ncbi:MAG: YdcF family protein, partial [Pirellulales bacterium]|nr:YdcF family protein [Pirellulales bacterium]